MPRSRSHTRRTPRSNPRGVLSVTPDGFGFVTCAEGEFFIPASKLGGAFDGDVVEVAPAHVSRDRKPDPDERARVGDRPTARVVGVVQRAHETVIGRYEVADPFGVVVPSDPRIPYDIFTMRADRPDIVDGSIVRVRMVEYPTRRSAATGVIEDVLGVEGEPAMDIEAVIGRHKLETVFSEGTLAEAAAARVDAEGAIAAGYKDLRERFVFTVDPVDARDFDDALSVEELGEGRVRLGVHIADVAAYVPWGGSIDFDARRRATSVYLADRVIPMLPEALSNDVCSLVPGAGRRTMTCDIVLDAHARVQSVDIYEAVIESKARLSYDQALALLEATDDSSSLAAVLAREEEPYGAMPLTEATCARLQAALLAFDRVAQAREAARAAAGGIDFGGKEAKVVLDEAGEPVDVRLRVKTRATRLVEEAMILANECVAQRLRDAGCPAIFRVHEKPTPDALADLIPVLQELGYDRQAPSASGDFVGALYRAPAAGGRDSTNDAALAAEPAASPTRPIDFGRLVVGDPFTVQAVLSRAKGRPEEELVANLVLRAMQRAEYKPYCAPHYGLASQAYLHFTSPIRRYPDLVAHRMCKELLHGRSGTHDAQVDSLAWLAEHASKMERIADAAARETQELMLVRLMQPCVGQSFDGVVSGVATAGLFVRLENTVEGLVPLRALGAEYFALDPVRHVLTGQDSLRTYRLGQRIRVRVEAAPDHARKLDLRLA